MIVVNSQNLLHKKASSPYSIDFLAEQMLNNPDRFYRMVCFKMLHKGYSRLVNPPNEYIQNKNLKRIIINFKSMSRRTLPEFFP